MDAILAAAALLKPGRTVMNSANSIPNIPKTKTWCTMARSRSSMMNSSCGWVHITPQLCSRRACKVRTKRRAHRLGSDFRSAAALMNTVPGFDLQSVNLEGTARAVYRAGSGPAVIVMSEIPGITPAVAGFARRLVDSGYTVFMPLLFGEPMRPLQRGYALRTILKACISREFRVLAANQSSPIVDWLRALARRAHGECGGRGVGAIGMCFTGNFALAMMLNAPVLAPILAQPSMPIPAGSPTRSAGL